MNHKLTECPSDHIHLTLDEDCSEWYQQLHLSLCISPFIHCNRRSTACPEHHCNDGEHLEDIHISLLEGGCYLSNASYPLLYAVKSHSNNRIRSYLHRIHKSSECQSHIFLTRIVRSPYSFFIVAYIAWNPG